MDIIYIRIEINKTEKKNNNRKEDGPSQREEKEDWFICIDYLYCLFVYNKNVFKWEFPGGPVVRTLRFHCQGHWLDPWSGNQDPVCHAM